MNRNELINRLNQLSIWKKGDQRAPHKPLLILYAIGDMQKESHRLIPYNKAREKLKELLVEFGPLRSSYHPEQPFVRLVNDGIWDLSQPINTSKFTNKQLIDKQISAGFKTEIYLLLKNDIQLQKEVAETVLDAHFPETLHEDILDSIGLDFTVGKRSSRDPKFRERVLKAYEYRCAVCGFNVRLGNHLVGTEAAHIKWRQAGGPDTEENGIALCSLHHKLFDRGIFTINHDRKFLVSEYANGGDGFEEWVMKYHG
ncbi:phosphorothioated DNA-binding restriction endonuclease, partial [Bacillus sp. JJ1474]|uniref:phosphorothioated DNA-binding restriction endonuclease n=1 Tax=Bacillus sp. JJ1474 TaxID=3122955 RepID=UPI003F68B73D